MLITGGNALSEGCYPSEVFMPPTLHYIISLLLTAFNLPRSSCRKGPRRAFVLALIHATYLRTVFKNHKNRCNILATSVVL